MKTSVIILFLLLCQTILAVPPRLLYEGTVLSKSGSAFFTGNAQFKFALVSGGGTQTLWSNDGTSVGGREPVSSVPASVKAGAVGVVLGAGMNEIAISVAERDDLKLRVWIDIGQGYEMFSPDQEPTPVLWALRARQAESLPDRAITPQMLHPDIFTTIQNEKFSYLWTPDRSTALLGLEANVVRIGTSERIGSLYVNGAIGVKGAIELGDSSSSGINGAFIDFHGGFGRVDEDFNVRLKNETDHMLTIQGGGLIVEGPLQLRSQEFTGEDNAIRFDGIGRMNTAQELTLQSGAETPLYLNPFHGGEVVVGSFSGDRTLRVEGITRTKALVITGGADVAERFSAIAESDHLEPGMVVRYALDGSQKIELSNQSYDRAVAGVLSDAGGINSGVVLEQIGSIASGEHKVAMMGRVRVWADASEAPIRVGDSLVSSPVPGYAMRALDSSRALGAIIGKATSNLNFGRGLIWMQVSLK